jgi:uncharacterized protein (TIGR02145 family)
VLSVTCDVTNTGNVSHSFGVGAEILDGSTNMSGLGQRTTSNISPSNTASVTFTYTIPVSWQAKSYILHAVVWSGIPGSSDWLNEDNQSFSLTKMEISLNYGRIAYHTYGKYMEDPIIYDNNKGHIFIYDLNTGEQKNITLSLPVVNAMNPHFSPDGAKIVFMAVPESKASDTEWNEEEGYLQRKRINLDIYMYDLAKGTLDPLTPIDGITDEDPKFNPVDGSTIIWKCNSQICKMRTDNQSHIPLPSSDDERSGPNYSPDSTKITYWVNSKANSSIGIMNYDGSSALILFDNLNIQDYYPIFRDNNNLLFSRWDSPLDKQDKIYNFDINYGISTKLNVNSEGFEDADASPINDDYLLFSSGRGSFNDNYDVYIGRYDNGNVYQLINGNTTFNDLGGVYSPYRYARSLEIISPTSGGELLAGSSVILQVHAYSDGDNWFNTSPSVTFSGSINQTYADLRDDGTQGDVISGDGIYSKIINLPDIQGTYTVVASATSTEPQISHQINSKEVTIDLLSLPAKPDLASPANDASDVSTSPTLSWYSSLGATFYRLVISTSSTFSTAFFDQSGITGTSFSLTGLGNNALYYWRVLASNTFVDSDWSDPRHFTTIEFLSIPDLSTTIPSNIAITSATSGGNINDNGGSPVTARGVCWSTEPQPTVDLATKTTDGTGTEPFTRTITGLSAGTTYYLRAYATNSVGTGYGNETSFKTYNLDAIQDIEGNYYNIVTIGYQIWMIENLKTTSFNDGISIPNVTDNAAWAALSTPGYCWYNNDITNKNTYGALYNWYSVNTGILCPTGWHVPTDDEWTTLTDYLGGESVAGGKLKETGTTHWQSPNTGATNESGFTALPGGTRYVDGGGTFYGIYYWPMFWTSTFNYTRSLYYENSTIWRGSFSRREYGFSVRCLKNIAANQSINLTSGWNILSSAVQPSNMSMRTIVDPLITASTLVKVQDEEGRAIERLSDPIGWINEIGQMSVTEGYKIRVIGNTSLSLTGQPVTLPMNIPLETGWNIIGYPVMGSQSSSAAFSSLINAGSLLKVQNEQGQAIEQISGTWNYGFLNLNPGEGYKVKTNAATILTISSAGKGETLYEEKITRKPVHFQPVYAGNGLDHMNIYLDGPTEGGTGLRSGDEIGVYDGGICVGAGVVEGTENRYIQVIASLDDPVTEIRDGFTEGNTLELWLWNAETGIEREAVDIEPEKEYSKTFERQGTTVLKVDFEGILQSFLEDAYPNPSMDRTTFVFQMAGESKVRLEIIDVMGNIIKILVDETMPGGLHQVDWDNKTASGNKAKAGIYFYRLSMNGLSQIKQLVIH